MYVYREKRQDENNNKKFNTINKRLTTVVDGSTTLLSDSDSPLITCSHKAGFFRRSNTIATPHRRYGTVDSSITTDNKLAGPLKRTRVQLQSQDFLRRKSRAKPPPDEIKRLYEQQYAKNTNSSKPTPKKAWEQNTDPKTNAKPSNYKNDLDQRLGAYGAVPSKIINADEISKDDDIQQLESIVAPVEDAILEVKQQKAKQNAIPQIVEPQIQEDPNPLVEVRFSQNSFDRRVRPRSMIDTGSASTVHDEKSSSDDLESSLDSFMKGERERMFERTQMRRSYIRLPRADDDDFHKPSLYSSELDLTATKNSIQEEVMSPTFERSKLSSSRSSSVSSHAASIMSSLPTDDAADIYSSDASRALEEDFNDDGRRHSDIRERIRRYKESSSSSSADDQCSERRKSSIGTSIRDENEQSNDGKSYRNKSLI